MGTDMKGYEVAYKGRVYPVLEMHMIWEGSRRREEGKPGLCPPPHSLMYLSLTRTGNPALSMTKPTCSALCG